MMTWSMILLYILIPSLASLVLADGTSAPHDGDDVHSDDYEIKPSWPPTQWSTNGSKNVAYFVNWWAPLSCSGKEPPARQLTDELKGESMDATSSHTI